MLETESRNALRRRLPYEWVVRDLDQDYGTDLEVEIFKDDRSTGLIFHVQVKGTDNPSDAEARKVRLSRENFNYLNGLAVPVLLARYQSTTGNLFVRWAHALDPYPRRRIGATITFDLDQPDDAWDPGTPDRLAADVAALRELSPQYTRIPLPIELEIDGNINTLFGVSAPLLRRRILAKYQELSHIVRVVPAQNGERRPIVRITPDLIVADVIGKYSASIHLKSSSRSEPAKTDLPADSLVALGLAIARAGHDSVAAMLFRGAAGESRLLENDEIAAYASRSFARSGHLREAFETAEAMIEGLDDDRQLSIFNLLLPGRLEMGALSPEDNAVLIRVLRRMAETSETRGKPEAAAAHFYSLANHLRAAGKRREAFRSYRRAGEMDSSYHERPYWLAEVAGTLYELGRFRLSAALYDKARGLGFADADLRPRQADATAFTGRYSDAIALYNEYVGDHQEEIDSWWFLWASLLPSVREAAGTGHQQRDRKGAIQLADAASGCDEGVLANALRCDALCGLAWFNLGITFNQQGRHADAALVFMICALIQRWDLEAFCNAVLSAGAVKDGSLVGLFGHGIRSAYEAHGDAFLVRIAEIADSQGPADSLGEFLAGIEQIVADIKERKRARSIRVRLMGPGDDEPFELDLPPAAPEATGH